MSTQATRNTTTTEQQSLVFNSFNEYVPVVIRFGIVIACIVMKLAIFSNVLEGCIYAHIYIHNRRNENKGLIDALLSEASRIKRNRKKTINIQMTCISWLLEFVAGLFGILQLMVGWLRLVTELQSATIFLSLILLSVSLNFVVIPSTYLLHTDMCKAFVITQGWWQSFKTLFSLNRVASIQNVDMEDNGHSNFRTTPNVSSSKDIDAVLEINPSVKSYSELRPPPILTISESVTVHERTGLRVLRNNYM